MGDQLMDESIMWTSCKGSADAWMVAPWERHEHSIPWWDTWVQLIGATCWLSLMGISSRMLIKINYQHMEWAPIKFHQEVSNQISKQSFSSRGFMSSNQISNETMTQFHFIPWDYHLLNLRKAWPVIQTISLYKSWRIFMQWLIYGADESDLVWEGWVGMRTWCFSLMN